MLTRPVCSTDTEIYHFNRISNKPTLQEQQASECGHRGGHEVNGREGPRITASDPLGDTRRSTRRSPNAIPTTTSENASRDSWTGSVTHAEADTESVLPW